MDLYAWGNVAFIFLTTLHSLDILHNHILCNSLDIFAVISNVLSVMHGNILWQKE